MASKFSGFLSRFLHALHHVFTTPFHHVTYHMRPSIITPSPCTTIKCYAKGKWLSIIHTYIMINESCSKVIYIPSNIKNKKHHNIDNIPKGTTQNGKSKQLHQKERTSKSQKHFSNINLFLFNYTWNPTKSGIGIEPLTD